MHKHKLPIRPTKFHYQGHNYFLIGWISRRVLRGLGFKERNDIRVKRQFSIWVNFSGLARALICGLSQKIESLIVPKATGGFGNQVFQIVRAIALARRTNISTIFLPESILFREPRELRLELRSVSVSSGAPRIENRLSATYRSPRSAPKMLLVGNSFYVDKFLDPISSDEYAAAFDILRTLGVGIPVRRVLPISHLVIHLRTGREIFGKSPHRDYFPPPLSFYEVVARLGGWAEATFVRGASPHPLEDDLITLFDQLNIPSRIHNVGFTEDLEMIGSATSLVASQGTFVPAIVGLTQNVKNLYVFGQRQIFARGNPVIRIVDLNGTYEEKVGQGNWSASVENLSLVRSYATENLGITS